MTTMRELLKGSMRLINVIGAGEEPTADDTQIALSSLNGLVQSLGNDINNIYTVQPYYFPLTPGKQHYTLGPAVDASGNLTGADWATTRPMRIEQARLMLYPTIQYPTPPDPTDPTCQYQCSVQDEFTTVMWHFDEGLGAASTSATLYDGEAFNADIATNTGQWTLSNTCCATGLQALNTSGGSTQVDLMTGSNFGSTADYTLGGTIEFLLRNDGSTNPTTFDYAEVFRSVGYSYGGGDGIITLRGYKVGQQLNFTRDGDVEFPIATIDLPIDTCVAIAIEWTPDGYLNLYQNGVQFYSVDVLYEWAMYAEPDRVISNFAFFSNIDVLAHNLAIDEFRGSNKVRYNAASYQYLR